MHSPNKTDQSLLSRGVALDFTPRYLKTEYPTAHQKKGDFAEISILRAGSAWPDESVSSSSAIARPSGLRAWNGRQPSRALRLFCL